MLQFTIDFEEFTVDLAFFCLSAKLQIAQSAHCSTTLPPLPIKKRSQSTCGLLLPGQQNSFQLAASEPAEPAARDPPLARPVLPRTCPKCSPRKIRGRANTASHEAIRSSGNPPPFSKKHNNEWESVLHKVYEGLPQASTLDGLGVLATLLKQAAMVFVCLQAIDLNATQYPSPQRRDFTCKHLLHHGPAQWLSSRQM